jgi:hypothetical protein
VKNGDDISEQVHEVPQKYIVIKTIRPKYVKRPVGPARTRNEDQPQTTILSAPLPPRMLPWSIATPSLLAHVLSGKFCDGLPFYRQEKIFARHGLIISRQDVSVKSSHSRSPSWLQDGIGSDLSGDADCCQGEPGVLDDQAMEILGIDIPGQQGRILGLGYGRQFGKQVSKVVVRIQPVELGRLDDAVQVGTGKGAPGATTDHPVLSFMWSSA